MSIAIMNNSDNAVVCINNLVYFFEVNFVHILLYKNY